MAFSTVEKIRTDSGFAENSNIADEVFSSYQEEAYAHIISIVASRYTIQGGISTLVDADPWHKVLALIERLLTAGMVMNKEFPWDETEESRKGNAHIDRADNMLKQIADGTLRLLFSSGAECPQLSASGRSGNSRLVATNFEDKDFPESPQW